MTSPAVGRTRRPLGRLVASILWACAAAAVLVLVCADGPDTDLLASGGAAGAVERSSQVAGDVVSIPDGGGELTADPGRLTHAPALRR